MGSKLLLETSGGESLEKLRFRQQKLKNGGSVNYYFGLTKDSYRGLSYVNHGGFYNGFVSDMVRFPEQHFTVIVLANTAEIEATNTALKIADIYLEKNFKTSTESEKIITKKAVELDPRIFDDYVGVYEVEGGKDFTLSYRRDGGRYFARATEQNEFEIFPLGPNRFFLKVVDAEVEFHRDTDGKINRLSHYQGGKEFKANRKNSLEVTEPSKAIRADTSAFVGNYWSEEMQSWLTISQKKDKLFLIRPNSEPLTLTLEKEDVLLVTNDLKIIFKRDLFSKIKGFEVNWSRIRHVRFERLP